jgi:hypothetical protein
LVCEIHWHNESKLSNYEDPACWLQKRGRAPRGTGNAAAYKEGCGLYIIVYVSFGLRSGNLLDPTKF